MITKEYTILAAEGLHARPAKEFLKLVRQFKSKVMISKDDDLKADAGSMLGILSMQAAYNSKITLNISGEDEAQAAEGFDRFFNDEIIKL